MSSKSFKLVVFISGYDQSWTQYKLCVLSCFLRKDLKFLEAFSLFVLGKTIKKSYSHEERNVYVNVFFVLIWRVINPYTNKY